MPTTALVHDYLLVMRGAERAFSAIAECWQDAPIYTLLYDALGTGGQFEGRSIHTSYLQPLGLRQENFRRLLPLFPSAVRGLPTDSYDLVVSSTSAFAHGIKTRPGAAHICYCYTPFRYAWHERDSTASRVVGPLQPIARRGLARFRSWDVNASRGVTDFITISELSRKRIQDYYGRDATIVHPPVEVDRFSIGEAEDFFLVVTELVHHKRVEVALEAARRTGVPIKVVGGGPALKELTRDYGDTAEFLGRISDRRLEDLHRRARALVVPNVEEFGIAAVEAQASGRPVLGAGEGGVKETVIDGETGVLVPPHDVDAIAEAMREVDWEGFDPERIREHATQFSVTEFKRRFHEEVMRLSAFARVDGAGEAAGLSNPPGKADVASLARSQQSAPA